jgi:hypothetical protein
MSNPAFLIDGHLEKKVLQNICPSAVIRILQCNGKDVALQAIADRVSTHCRLFHGKYYPLIVIIDREDRKETAQDIIDDLLNLLNANGITDKMIIAVADRNIENWILGDIELISDLHPSVRQYCKNGTDGFNGKTVLKKSITNYHETTIGVDLLTKCRPSKMRSSPSFEYLYQQVTQLDCRWLLR